MQGVHCQQPTYGARSRHNVPRNDDLLLVHMVHYALVTTSNPDGSFKTFLLLNPQVLHRNRRVSRLCMVSHMLFVFRWFTEPADGLIRFRARISVVPYEYTSALFEAERGLRRLETEGSRFEVPIRVIVHRWSLHHVRRQLQKCVALQARLSNSRPALSCSHVLQKLVF